MIWQDVVLGGAGIGFTVMLVPVLRDPLARVPRWTSVPNAALCSALAIAQGSLGLDCAKVGSWGCMCAWIWIAQFRSPR